MRRCEGRNGYSLVEMLVVMAIIAILAALYLPALSKARRQADVVVVKETLRQHHVGRMADDANIARPQRVARGPGRDAARRAFRQEQGRDILTEMLYVVRNEAEFTLYYNALVAPGSNVPLQWDSLGRLVLPGGQTLEPLVNHDFERGEVVPVAWEFISTHPSDMSSSDNGAHVLYSDGSKKFLRYPSTFPITETVAELSHAYAAATR